LKGIKEEREVGRKRKNCFIETGIIVVKFPINALWGRDRRAWN